MWDTFNDIRVAMLVFRSLPERRHFASPRWSATFDQGSRRKGMDTASLLHYPRLEQLLAWGPPGAAVC